MADTQQLITTLNDLSKIKYFKKSLISSISEQLQKIKERSTGKDVKYIDSLLNIISKVSLKVADQNRIRLLKVPIVNAIKKYEEEYEEEENEDNENEELTVDKIEE